MMFWILVLIVVLTLRWLLTSTIKTTLTSKNELFLVRINRAYDAVLDTGSIYTILHSPNVNTTLPSTIIQYGSQTSTVYFDTRDVRIGPQSFQYSVGMALPRPSHYNILGLARGSPWIPCHVHFSQRWVAFEPSPAPMTLNWIQPPHLPAHVYVLPVQIQNVPLCQIKYMILDTGSNITSLPKRAFELFQHVQDIDVHVQGRQHVVFEITAANIAGDCPFPDTMIVGSMFLRSFQLWIDSDGCILK